MSGVFSDVLHQYKLFHVIIYWGRVTLNVVLKWSLEYRNKDIATLYETDIKNICKKAFHSDQINILKNVDTIDTLDISVAFLLLLHVGGLSKPDDPAWHNSPSLEYSLKMVKFHRNNSCHHCDSMTEKDSKEKITELRQLYGNILSAAGNRFHVEEDVVKMKIDEITIGVDGIHEKIRETFDPNNKQHIQNFRKELQNLKNEINREVIQEAQAKLHELNSYSTMLRLVPWTPYDYSAKPSELYVPTEYELTENSKTNHGTIKNILDSIINDLCTQQFWIVCGERGSGKTMLCKYLIEESTIHNISSWQTKYSFILYCQDDDYKYDSLDEMVKHIFHEVYCNNGLPFEYFMEILKSVPILVVIDGHTESHIKLLRDIVTRSNISAVITNRPGSHSEIKNLLIHKAKMITNVNILKLKNEIMEKIVCNVLTLLKCQGEIKALTTKINEEMDTLGTWLKYPLGILIMAVLWIHKEIGATTNSCIIQRLFLNQLANRFKDEVYRFNLCSTMDKANEKCKDIIEKCKEIFEKSNGIELKKQTLEILQKFCKVNSLPEEYTLSSFFDSKIEIQRLEECKIRTLPCHFKINVVKKLDSTHESCAKGNYISYNSHNALKLINSIPRDRNINSLLKVVYENDNNLAVANAAASKIDTKNCRIKEGYLEALPAVFNFTQPTEVIFETSKDPNAVHLLLPSIKFVSERSIISRIYLIFEYNYYNSNNGIDNKYIELLAKNETCRLLSFLGCLTLSGLSLLPKWIERLYLRITDNQISTLNENLPRLKNLTLLTVVLDLSKTRPRPEFIDCIKYMNRNLNLQIAADITDEEAEYASHILVKLCPRGIKSLNEIQFKDTHLTSAGVNRCLEELHTNDIITQKIIFWTTEIISEEEMTCLRFSAFTYDMKQLEIKYLS